MPYTTVTLSSANVSGPSSPIALNWRGGGSVLWSVTTNSSVGTGDFTVQYTLDDIQLTTNSSVYPYAGSATYGSSVNTVWTALSSNPFTSPTAGSGIHYTSSTIFPDGIVGTFLAPPAAIRLFSTACSSNTLYLKVLQKDGG